MVNRVARITCVLVAGWLAACGGSGPNGEQPETGEGSAIVSAAGASDVAVDVSQTDTRAALEIAQAPAVFPSSEELPEREAGLDGDRGLETALPVAAAALHVASPIAVINRAAVVAPGLGKCPPCAINRPRPQQ